MAQETWTKKQFFAELDNLGEDKVRELVIAGIYGNTSQKRGFANEWLRLKEEGRAAASQSEQTEIARSARDAAVIAADAARVAASEAKVQSEIARSANQIARAANRRATIALVIAAISAAVLIIDSVRRLMS